MNKINHKAVVLVFLLQILLGFAWYSGAPVSLVNNSDSVSRFPSINHTLLFCLASFVYLYFTAWLLVKLKPLSSLSMMIFTLGVWVCTVLPNYIFMSVFLHLEFFNVLYLLSYGALSCLLAAIVLPLWRSSRSIFKG